MTIYSEYVTNACCFIMYYNKEGQISAIFALNNKQHLQFTLIAKNMLLFLHSVISIFSICT